MPSLPPLPRSDGTRDVFVSYAYSPSRGWFQSTESDSLEEAERQEAWRPAYQPVTIRHERRTVVVVADIVRPFTPRKEPPYPTPR